MLKFGSLKEAQAQSAIDGLATVRPKNQNPSLAQVTAPLMLTSLVDAFAVIVIYLLVSTYQGKKEIEVEGKIKLPVAEKAQMIEPGVSVSVVENKYLYEGKDYSLGQLLTLLREKNTELTESADPRKGRIIIQADKNSDFKYISPVLSVASQTGFDDIHFATVGSE